MNVKFKTCIFVKEKKKVEKNTKYVSISNCIHFHNNATIEQFSLISKTLWIEDRSVYNN